MSIVNIPMQAMLVGPTSRKGTTKGRGEYIVACQAYVCANCGVRLMDGRTREKLAAFQIDHILPIALAGTNEDDNLQALCIPCHKIKSAQDIKRIRKAARIRQRIDGQRRKRKAILNGGFNKTLTRGFDGKVKARSSSAKRTVDAVPCSEAKRRDSIK